MKLLDRVKSQLDKQYTILPGASKEEKERIDTDRQKAAKKLLLEEIEKLKKQATETEKEAEMLFSRHTQWGLLSQQEINSKIDQPVLFLMRDDLSVDVIEGLVPGPLEIKNKKNLVAGHLFLNAKKLHIVKWGSGHIRAWFAYEREATCYPIDIIFDAQTIVGEMLNLLMNMKTYAANKMPGGKYDWIWMVVIGIVLIIVAIGLLSIFGFSVDKMLHGADAASPAVSAINATINGTVIK